MANLTKYKTIKQLVESGAPFSEAGLRWQVFHAQENGLSPALLRVGKKLLIDEEAFEQWLKSKGAQPVPSPDPKS